MEGESEWQSVIADVKSTVHELESLSSNATSLSGYVYNYQGFTLFVLVFILVPIRLNSFRIIPFCISNDQHASQCQCTYDIVRATLITTCVQGPTLYKDHLIGCVPIVHVQLKC